MPIVGASKSILAETRDRIGKSSSILTTNKQVSASKSILTVTKLHVQASKSILCKSTSAAYNQVISTVSGGSSARVRTLGGALYVKNLTTGVTKQIPITDIENLNISKKRNEPFSWTATLDNRTRNYSPYNLSSTYYGWLFPDIWNSSGLIEKVWQIKIITGGRTWESPYLTLIDYSHSGSQGSQITLTGSDLTEYLLRENQTMASWISRPGTVYMAKQIEAQILANFKVTKYNLSHTDYPVWKLHFQGERPLDILNRLWDIPNCTWRWKGDTIYVGDPAWKPNGPADWTYKSGDNLILVNYKRSKAALVNIVEARRTLDSVFQGADQEGNDVGSKEITFTQPIWNVTLQRETKDCYIDYVYYWNANGEIATIPTGIEPITKITFIVIPLTANTNSMVGRQYYWRVIARGMENYSDTILGTSLFDQEYHVRVTNETSVNKYGPRPQREPEENPLIPNKAWAKTYCERKLDNSGRLVETLTFECPANPFMEPEDTVNINEAHTGINGYFLVENVDINISGGDISQQFGCSKYLQ